MTQMIAELRRALVEAGASEPTADAAAAAVAGAGEVATKADLVALEVRLVRWGTVLVLGANALLFAALRLTG